MYMYLYYIHIVYKIVSIVQLCVQEEGKILHVYNYESWSEEIRSPGRQVGTIKTHWRIRVSMVDRLPLSRHIGELGSPW